MQSKPCFPSKLPCRGLCLLTAEIFLRRHAGLGLEDAVEIVQIVIADLRGGLLDRHAAQQELLRRPLLQLTDSASYEAESGTLTFTVPQELEEQEIRLNLTLLTADGEQWQGFSQENSENSWVPGQTYTAQIDGLEQMVVLCNLGGVSMSSSVGFTAEKGYQGIGMSNLPQG